MIWLEMHLKISFLNERNAPNFHYYVATIVCENQKDGSPLIENGTKHNLEVCVFLKILIILEIEIQ